LSVLRGCAGPFLRLFVELGSALHVRANDLIPQTRGDLNMMKWLHLPWHIEGNRVIDTIPGEEICRFSQHYLDRPVEENRMLQFALDRIVYRRRDPWVLLAEAIERVERAGYVLLPQKAAA
jgi:hypothetical protein